MGRKPVEIKDGIPFDIGIEKTEFFKGNHKKIVDAASWNFECCDCSLVHNVFLVASKHKIKVIMHRDNRATSQLRRYKKD